MPVASSRQAAAATTAEGGPQGAGTATPAVHPDWTAATMNIHAPCDLLLVSVDSLRFHVHQGRLGAASTNSFGDKLPMPLIRADEQGSSGHGLPVLNLPYIGAVLNILLYIVYNRVGRIRNPDPSLSDLSSTFLALKEYGAPLEASLSESSRLFGLFSSMCESGSPLDVYATAAFHAPDLHHVAVYASQFLLTLDLYSVTDELADKMGAVYLRRLFMLHVGRVDEFKKLIVGPPRAHTPTQQCNAGTLLQVWALATAYLTWAASPNVTATAIDNVLVSIIDRLNCHRCETSLRERFDMMKQKWSLVKVSEFPLGFLLDIAKLI